MPVAQTPPTIDPIAASRWQRVAPLASPWLHEEVASRMLDRLQWIKLQPTSGRIGAPCAAACRPTPRWLPGILMQHVL